MKAGFQQLTTCQIRSHSVWIPAILRFQDKLQASAKPPGRLVYATFVEVSQVSLRCCFEPSPLPLILYRAAYHPPGIPPR